MFQTLGTSSQLLAPSNPSPKTVTLAESQLSGRRDLNDWHVLWWNGGCHGYRHHQEVANRFWQLGKCHDR